MYVIYYYYVYIIYNSYKMYSYLTKCILYVWLPIAGIRIRGIRTFNSPFTLSIVNSSYRWCCHPDCPPLVLEPLPCCPRFVGLETTSLLSPVCARRHAPTAPQTCHHYYGIHGARRRRVPTTSPLASTYPIKAILNLDHGPLQHKLAATIMGFMGRAAGEFLPLPH